MAAMEDPKWLRFLTIGLVLAAVAVGYFLLSGRLAPSSVRKSSPQASANVGIGVTPSTTARPSVLGQNTQVSPNPTPTAGNAYSRIVNRNQQNVQTLPATGFPVELTGPLLVSVMLTGWGLRRFPH